MRRLLTLTLMLISLTAMPVVASAATSPKKAIILSGDAVGPVRFGESQSAAAASLIRLLGKSDGGVQNASNGDCIISAALYWPNFAAYFYHGKFDGYQTGTFGKGRSKPNFNGATPQGLRVGFTLARARKLYGSHFSISGAQNGVYAAATATGTIRGYLSTEPSLEPAKKVTLISISAGSVGCPAMSPG